MTSSNEEKFCYLVSVHTTSARRLCSSVPQFLIYSAFVVDNYLLMYAIDA